MSACVKLFHFFLKFLVRRVSLVGRWYDMSAVIFFQLACWCWKWFSRIVIHASDVLLVCCSVESCWWVCNSVLMAEWFVVSRMSEMRSLWSERVENHVGMCIGIQHEDRGVLCGRWRGVQGWFVFLYLDLVCSGESFGGVLISAIVIFWEMENAAVKFDMCCEWERSWMKFDCLLCRWRFLLLYLYCDLNGLECGVCVFFFHFRFLCEEVVGVVIL